MLAHYFSVSPTLYYASRTVCQLEKALKFHLNFDLTFHPYSQESSKNLGPCRFDGTHGGAKPVHAQIRHFQLWADSDLSVSLRSFNFQWILQPLLVFLLTYNGQYLRYDLLFTVVRCQVTTRERIFELLLFSACLPFQALNANDTWIFCCCPSMSRGPVSLPRGGDPSVDLVIKPSVPNAISLY